MLTLCQAIGPLLLALTVVACAPEPGSDDANRVEPDLVGSWRLESWTVGGAPRCGPGEGQTSGQIMYSSDGHMSAQLGCGDGAGEDLGDASPEQVMSRMQRRHFSYYGTYELDLAAGTVTHHVEGSSSFAWVGTDRVRSFVFEGPDRIRLSTMESDNDLVWVRN